MADAAPTMTHDDVLNTIPWYLNGTLTHDERCSMEAHIESCAECRSELAAQRKIRDAVMNERATPMITAPAADSILSTTVHNRNVLRARSRMLPLAAAIGGVAIVVAALVFSNTEHTNVNQQYETLTADSAASEIDLVVEVRFSTSQDTMTSQRMLAEFGGSDITATERQHEYRMTMRGQPASLEHINSVAAALEARPGVESARVIALQVPMQ